MAKRVYRITHNYQIGNQDVFVESERDPTGAAIYCQFIAESVPEGRPEKIVSNLGIASALVTFYECSHCAATEDAVTIDMHFDRSKRCGSWWSENEHNSPLARHGLAEYLQPHIE